MQAIVQPLTQGLGTFFAFVPQLVGAVVILIVGYVIARSSAGAPATSPRTSWNGPTTATSPGCVWDGRRATARRPHSTAGKAGRPGALTVRPNYLRRRSSWGSLRGLDQVARRPTRRGGSPALEIAPLALVSPGGFVFPTVPALREHGAQFSDLGLQAGYLV